MPETSARQTICVIGAGLTGLTAAHRLLNAGYDVIVLESALHAGGMISTFKLGREPIEYIYHHTFTSDSHLMDLTAELGLSDQISWHQSKEALFSNDHLYPFSSPADLLRFNSISLWQRLKTGLTVLKAGRISNWQHLENQTAAGWLCRQGGKQAYDRLWKPLLNSKFEQDADDVSAVWIWNKFKLRGHSREKGSGKSLLGYMKGGFGTLIDTLAKSIQARGGRIFFGHTAMNISREPSPGISQDDGSRAKYRITCVLSDCSSVDFVADAVISTTSSRQFANISSGLELSDSYLKQVLSLHYKGDLCMILRLKKSLSPYYWTTVCDDLPFVVVVEHTHLTGPERYGGHVVYLSRYLDASSPLWTQSDGAIYKQFTQGLMRMYPDFTPADIIDWRLRRTRYAQPVIGCSYSERMPAMNTPDPGVKLAGMAQIYPEDRGMNYAIRLGDQAADAIVEYFSEQPDPC